jgi:hypothetical protein
MRLVSMTLFGLLACMAIIAVNVRPAACETKLSPSVSVRALWDDSMLGKGDSDGELALSPAIGLDWRRERTKAAFKARLDAYEYLEHDEYSRENAQISADLTHAATERLGLRLGGMWVRDHTVEDEFEESGITTEKVARNTLSASPGLTFRPTERDELSLDAFGTLVDYELSGYADYHVLGATATWSQAMADGLLRLILQAGGQTYSFDRTDGDTDQMVLTALAGVAWKATELLEFQAMGGVSRTSSEVTFDDYPQFDQDEEQLTFSGSLTGTWTDQVWRLTLAADRSESPSTYGELITRDRLRFSFGRNLSEYFFLGLNGAFYISKTAGLVQEEDTRTWSLGPALRWRFAERTSVDVGYSFIHEDDRQAGNTTDRSQAWLGVTVEWPREW